jgi:DNA-binding transcriptional MerR regulator
MAVPTTEGQQMRIGELSRRSGVAVPTIKYYLREGLLEPGVTRAANQADYGDAHVKRLRLIRALLDVGGVSISAARDVIAALGRTDLEPHDLLGVAHHAVSPTRHPDRDTDAWRDARAAADQFVAERGWRVESNAPARDQLADVIAALHTVNAPEILTELDAYAASALSLAEVEVDNVIARGEPVRMLELVVLGTVLGEALFAALRLLAHEHASMVRLGARMIR